MIDYLDMLINARVFRLLASRLLVHSPNLWRNARGVFVLSTGRTATDTLAQLLKLSPQVDAFHEPPPQLLEHRQAAFWHVRSDPLHFAAIFKAARASRLFRSFVRGRVYAETSARLTFFAPAIYCTMDRAKFIYIYRHPGDVVRSGMRRGWYQGHPADWSRIIPHRDDPLGRVWTSMDAFAKICWYWRAYNEFAIAFVNNVSSERVYSLRFEDFVRGTPEVVRNVFDFIGIAPPDLVAVESVFAAKHNRQREGFFPEWRDWNSEQKETLIRIAGDVMSALGYDVDGSM